MSYVTPDDVRAVLSADGTATPGSASSFDDVALQAQIDEAQAEVDARLAARYQVPFADGNAPALVARITRDKAAWLATLIEFAGVPLEATHPVQLRANAAESLLAGVVSGTIDLTLANAPSAEQPVENDQGGASVVNQYDGEMFTLGELGIGPAFSGQYRVRPGSWWRPPY